MLRKVFLCLPLASNVAAADLSDDFDTGEGAGLNGRMPGSGVNLKQIQKAFDSARTTENVYVFQVDKMEAPRIRLREFMETLIVLPKGEAIEGYSLGDKSNFSVTPLEGRSANVMRVRPTYPGADTNLTLMGKSGRIYPFYLRVDSVDSDHMPMFVVYIESDGSASFSTTPQEVSSKAEAQEPKQQTAEEIARAEGEYLRSLGDVDVTAVNCSYATSKGKWFGRGVKWFGRSASYELEPIRICDDGKWTYFRFSNTGHLDDVQQLPVVYQVVDGYDTPVNTRVQGGVIVAETTSKNWTLRAGDRHLCVQKL